MSLSTTTLAPAAAVAIRLHRNNLLLAHYITNNQMQHALDLFDTMPHRDAVSFNTLISAHGRSGHPRPAVDLFLRMIRSRVPPTCHTLSILLSSFPHPHLTPQLHAVAVRSSFAANAFVGSALVKAYASLKASAASLKRAFYEIQFKTPVAYTTLVVGLMDLNRAVEARLVFDEMPHRTTVACAALISGYIRNRNLESARRIFDDQAVEKNVVTWTTMIDGCRRFKKYREGLNLFVQMCREKAKPVKPNKFTYAAALTCAAGAADIVAGACVHAHVLKHGTGDHVLRTCIVEMYGKCGDGGSAVRAFEECGLGTRTIATWNAVIGACGKNGSCNEAIGLFNWMLTEGARPDSITFVNLLTACVHGGLVREGEVYFEIMEREFGVERGIEHYGCLVDLYARAGMREAAERVVKEMPLAADAAVLGAGFERRIRACEERGEWRRLGELKEERERRVGRRKGRGFSCVGSGSVVCKNSS